MEYDLIDKLAGSWCASLDGGDNRQKFISEVSARIPDDERQTIYERTASIGGSVFVLIPSQTKMEMGILPNNHGLTWWDDKARNYKIYIDCGLADDEELKYVIAHEFAHILFDHSRKAELEADAKAQNWGFPMPPSRVAWLNAKTP